MERDSVLLCAHDPELADELACELRLEGYETYIARARRQAMWTLAERRPAAVVLGDLPGLVQSLELLRDVRAYSGAKLGVNPDVPVLVLSPSAGELCEVRALEAGADEFLAADRSYLVLRTRLRALIRRSRITRRAERLEVGALSIDARRHEARYAGRPVELSSTEMALLRHLARHPHQVFTKEELLAEVWGYKSPGATRTVASHASRLRRKLAAAGLEGAIVNRQGVGYLLRVPADPAPAA